MSDATIPAAVPAEGSRGQSLGSIALLRLRRNKAAMASLLVLVVVSVVCVFGPFVYPHRYDEIFPSYVGVAPSLEPYPK